MTRTSPFPVSLSGAATPTLMWAHEHDVEAQALTQLRNIAALPWVEGVRVMPDVHLGKGRQSVPLLRCAMRCHRTQWGWTLDAG